MSLDISLIKVLPTEVYANNISHNLNSMAQAAGIYYYIWWPEELGISLAKDLITPLKEGLTRLVTTPEIYRKLNPSNKWGTYENLVTFVKSYIDACEKNPDSIIEICR